MKILAPSSPAAIRRVSWLCFSAAVVFSVSAVEHTMGQQDTPAAAEPPPASAQPTPPAPPESEAAAQPTPPAPPTADRSEESPKPSSQPAGRWFGAPGMYGDSAPTEELPVEAHPAQRKAEAASAAADHARAELISLTTFQQGQSNAETFFDGVGGIPSPLSTIYLNTTLSQDTGYIVGPLIVRPSLTAGANYSSSSGNSFNGNNSGFYGSLSPTVQATLGEPATGRLLDVQYASSLSFGDLGTDRSSRYDQTLTAAGTFNFTKLSLGAGLQLSQFSGSNRDFGGQNVNRVLLNFSVRAGYQYSEKSGFETSLSVPVRLFSRGSSSEGVTNQSFLNYAYSPTTLVGFGIGIGTLEVEQSNSQIFEQALFRFTSALSVKLALSGTLGCEFRQVEGGDDEVTPILGLGVIWKVREGTSLSLLGERHVYNSAALSGTNYVSSSISLSGSQRLGNYVVATGSVGYENAAYNSVEAGVSTSRDDNLFLLQGGLSVRFSTRWISSVIVSYGKNTSSDDQFSSNYFQSALQLSYVF